MNDLVTNQSDKYFYLSGLRENYGRSKNGPNRINRKMTITPETLSMMEVVVPSGKGKYGSAAFELALRMLLVLVSEGEDISMIGEELKRAVSSPYFSRNLRMLADYMDKNP